MSDASRRLVGRGSIYMIGSAAPMLTGLLVTPLLTRSVDVSEYGSISVAIVVMQWSIALLGLGLPVAITRHALTESSGPDGARSIAVIASSLVLAAASAIAGLALLVDRIGGVGLPVSILLAFVAAGAGSGTAMAMAWALAEERSWFYVVLAVGLSLMGPAVGLVCVSLVDARGATAYFLGVVATNCVLLAAGMGRVASTGRVTFDLGAMRKALKVGLPMVPHLFATGSLNGIAVIVAGAVIGHAAGGRAQVAVYLGTVALVLTSAIGYAWLPVLAQVAPDARGEQLAETSKAVAWLAGLTAGGVATLSPWLLMLLVPPRYDIATMVPVTAIACMSAALAAVYLAHQQVVVISGRTTRLALISPASMLIGALVSWAAASVYGLVGVAVGLPVVYLLLWRLTRRLAREVSTLRWAERGASVAVVFATGVCLTAALLPTSGDFAVAMRASLAAVLVVLGLMRLRTIFTKAGTPSVAPGASS
ncbi:lipopolysaccharide biosynthesis protein [Nocardioides hwasunensis]|uniref:Oligosaccharide flippase family protein n=1 Tax=Nocardioides hwasunensis TaxID=397258 RepID=A0ABR8MP67_9ACTN|nr:oligosaccharide flippase family protein [Nocardioides hwasunensis]MBD3916642.1 oligosaccharide flippase family protein [Nocardioides hwasunensis]